jgi:hypothetical protein
MEQFHNVKEHNETSMKWGKIIQQQFFPIFFFFFRFEKKISLIKSRSLVFTVLKQSLFTIGRNNLQVKSDLCNERVLQNTLKTIKS